METRAVARSEIVIRASFLDYSSSSYPTIVCDNGMYSLKVGFSWDDKPRSVIPTIVGVPANEVRTGPRRLRKEHTARRRFR